MPTQSLDKQVIYENNLHFKEFKQTIYFQKTKPMFTNEAQYFFKAFIQVGSSLLCQGYIYFYLDEQNKTSDFIGLYVKPEYRNYGLASLLVATWIDFCFNNNYNFLGTNVRQRKPFLLYLLKTFGFEILNPNIYETNRHVIYIAKLENDLTKYLVFASPGQQESFMRGHIAQEDNYKIATLSDDIQILDRVILSKVYNLDEKDLIENRIDTARKRFK